MTNLRELLISPIDYLAPEKVLEGLSDSDAARRLPGASHSIAEIVAHLAFWQDWFYARCAGQAVPMASSAAAGWPTPVEPWPAARQRFVDRLQQIAL